VRVKGRIKDWNEVRDDLERCVRERDSLEDKCEWSISQTGGSRRKREGWSMREKISVKLKLKVSGWTPVYQLASMYARIRNKSCVWATPPNQHSNNGLTNVVMVWGQGYLFGQPMKGVLCLCVCVCVWGGGGGSKPFHFFTINSVTL